MKKHIVKISFSIAILGVIMPLIIALICNTFDFNILSPVGDWVGGTAAPILSFAGFIMIYAAFIVQKEELEAQKDELKLTRTEFIHQNQTMALQRFENTFFHLITLHHEIIKMLEIKTYNGVYTGRNYFSAAFGVLKQFYSNLENKSDRGLIKIENKGDLLNISYEEFFQTEQDNLGHYYTNLYNLYRFIDNNEVLTEKQKQDYARIVRAQLSTYELVIIMYNGYYKYGERFREYIIKYNILDNLNKDLLIDKEEHGKIYDSLRH